MVKMILNVLGAFFICFLMVVSQMLGIHFCIEEALTLFSVLPFISYVLPWVQSKGLLTKKSSCPCGHDDTGAHGH